MGEKLSMGEKLKSFRSTARCLPLLVVALSALVFAAEVASASDVNRATCPNESSPGFRSYLPDCRAYELVTPPFKEGFPVIINEDSEDGAQLLVNSLGAFSNPEGTSGLGTLYRLERDSSGWTAMALQVPFSEFPNFEVVAMSPDFQSSLVFANSPSRPAVEDIYRGTPLGPFAYVGPGAPPAAAERVLGPLGASRDFSHMVFFVLPIITSHPKKALWPGDTTNKEHTSVYEYTGADNSEPRLVGVSDEHAVTHVSESHLISACGTYFGGPKENTYNAISESGTTIFFTALGHDYGNCGELDPNAEPAVNELYARLNASQTVAISEPSKEDCGECKDKLASRADAEFEGASLDGSKVFFTTVQHLLPGAEGEGPYLYEYDFNSPQGRRVTLVSGGDPKGARVQGVVRVSEDSSHVYFVANGVLTAVANSHGQQAEENAQNLYVYERDAAYPQGHMAFIAAGGAGTAQATPDGRFLVFESAADLTPDQERRREAGQVFEYDAQTGALARVSRGQAGYNEDGNTNVYRATIPTQRYTQDRPANRFKSLAMSGDGAYVFFTSEDALTPQALSGVVNIYEYHEGQVALISDGRDLVSVSEEPAVELVGTDESGRDVFFRTADGLVPQDTDTQLDVYDARIEGGFPALPAAPSCSEDSCQGPLAGTLQSLMPPTLSSGGESAVPTVSGGAAKGQPTSKRGKPKPKKKHRKKRARGVKKATRRGR